MADLDAQPSRLLKLRSAIYAILRNSLRAIRSVTVWAKSIRLSGAYDLSRHEPCGCRKNRYECLHINSASQPYVSQKCLAG